MALRHKFSCKLKSDVQLEKHGVATICKLCRNVIAREFAGEKSL
jgi:hypothetical protein